MSTADSRSKALKRGTLAPHYVYRCFDIDGDLIYIGCTRNVTKRIAAHRRGGKAASQWLAVCMASYEVQGPFVDRDSARAIEAAAIAREQPVFNIQERRVPIGIARAEVAYYLVERGHLGLALATACSCWGETKADGAFDSWCAAHSAEAAA